MSAAPLLSEEHQTATADMEAVVLDGCNWKPQDISELGCTEGALQYLGVEVSAAWLAGATGYAFFPFVPGECGHDPGYWTHAEYRGRLANVGCRVTALLSDQDGRKEDAIEAVRRGRPCVFYCWDAGEYVLLKGFEAAGMVLSFYGGDDAVRPWSGLGDAYTLKGGQAAPPAAIVRDGVSLALCFNDRAGTLVGHHSYHGNWRQLLDAGETFGWAMSLAALQMSGLRQLAAAFLTEAASRLDGKLAALARSAAVKYQAVSTAWQELAGLIPFPNLPNEQRQAYSTDPATVKRVRPVIDAIAVREAGGIEKLKQIVADDACVQ